MEEKRERILKIRDLDVSFRTSAGHVHALRGIDIDLFRGETLAIVGESGSGKSVTMKAAIHLLAANSSVNGGSVDFTYTNSAKEKITVDLLTKRIQRERGISVIYITHDLGVVANVADFVDVMYAGKIVEKGTAEEIFYDSRHPYTWGLLSAMPDLDTEDSRLYTIPGSPPNLIHEVAGDAFEPRNAYALKIDKLAEPPMFKITDTHYAATWLLDKRAPKVDMPEELRERLDRMMKEVDGYGG